MGFEADWYLEVRGGVSESLWSLPKAVVTSHVKDASDPEP